MNPPPFAVEADPRLRAAHRFLWDLNNLLLIPVFSLIVVELTAMAYGVGVLDLVWIDELNAVICVFFFSEWLLGLIIADSRRAYLKNPARIGDLISSIPVGYLAKGLRFVRLARVVRLFRVMWRMRRLRGQLRRILRVSGLVAAISTSGALSLRILEPQTVGSFAEAMWWSIVTMSTVGYGDISPVTPAGRGVAMSMIIVGIAIFGYAISVLTSLIGRPPNDESDELKDILLRMEKRLERLEAAQSPSEPSET